MSAISPNNNLSPLAFYPSREAREQWWGYGKTPNICVPKNFLPSLQIRRPHNTTTYLNFYDYVGSGEEDRYITTNGTLAETGYGSVATFEEDLGVFSPSISFVADADLFTNFEEEVGQEAAFMSAIGLNEEEEEEVLQVWQIDDPLTNIILPEGTTKVYVQTNLFGENTIGQTTKPVSIAPIIGCEIRNAVTNAHESSWIPTAFKIVNHGNYDYIFLTASKQYNTLPEGAHYLEITDGTNTWFSDNFTTKDADYLKIEWWNESNLDLADGTKLVFLMPNQSWFNWKPSLYIPTDIGMPDYEFEEEVEERGGYQFPLQQISYKKYKFNFLAPEVVCDAMRLIRLSDHIEITKGSAKYVANTFLMTPSWQDQGYLARVECEFTTDTIVKKNGKSI